MSSSSPEISPLLSPSISPILSPSLAADNDTPCTLLSLSGIATPASAPSSTDPRYKKIFSESDELSNGSTNKPFSLVSARKNYLVQNDLEKVTETLESTLIDAKSRANDVQPDQSLEEETEENIKSRGVRSHLDLPALHTKPSYETLAEALKLFSSRSGPTNFNPINNKQGHISNDDEEQDNSDNDDEDEDSFGKILATPGSGYFNWLTKLVGSPLDWIEDSFEQEKLWHSASLLMAEQCGRTATPKMTRRIHIDGMKEALIELGKLKVEPGFHSDPSEEQIPNKKDTSDDQSDIFLVEPSLTADLLGLKTWGSSFILSSRLVRERKNRDLAGESSPKILSFQNPVLELGTGTGLVGMTASRLGYDLTVTDLAEIIPNLETNVIQNKMKGDKISAEVLDWTDAKKDGFLDNHGPNSFNTILISDPIYSSNHPYLIRDMVGLFLAKPKAQQQSVSSTGDEVVNGSSEKSNQENIQLCLQLPLRPKFEDIRELLYNLLGSGQVERTNEQGKIEIIPGLGLKRIRYEEEEGYDDFGKSKFAFSLWTW